MSRNIVLDKDGVLNDVKRPAMKLFAYVLKHADEFPDFGIDPEAVRRLPPTQLFQYFNEAQSSLHGVGLNARVLLWFSKKFGHGREISPERLKEVNRHLSELFTLFSSEEPLFLEAKCFLKACGDKCIWIVSASGRVREWLKNNGIDQDNIEVYEYQQSKVEALIEIVKRIEEEVLFVTDSKTDIVDAQNANRILGKKLIIPIGVLTGLSSERTFQEMGIEYYRDLIEFGKQRLNLNI